MSKKEIVIPLFSAVSCALLSVFTLNPITIASALSDMLFISDSEIGPTPLPIILNSAFSIFVLLPIFSILKRFEFGSHGGHFIKTKNTYRRRKSRFIYHYSFEIFYYPRGANTILHYHCHSLGEATFFYN